jgi:hypothetical protein
VADDRPDIIGGAPAVRPGQLSDADANSVGGVPWHGERQRRTYEAVANFPKRTFELRGILPQPLRKLSNKAVRN